jgi:hypothetical protein
MISIVLAALTYRQLEKPIRQNQNSRISTRTLCYTLAGTAVFGLFTLMSDGLANRVPEPIRPFADFKPDYETDARLHQCWLSYTESIDFPADCVDSATPLRPKIAVWGDSYAARLYPGLRVAADGHYQLAQFTRDACAPILQRGYKNCYLSNFKVFDWIRTEKPDWVILAGWWNHYSYLSDLRFTLQALKEAGVKNILIVGAAPQWKTSLPATLFRFYIRDSSSHRIPERLKVGLKNEVESTDRYLQSHIERLPGVQYFSIYQMLCNSDGCLTRLSKTPESMVTWDDGHLTTSAATYVAKKLPMFETTSTQK